MAEKRMIRRDIFESSVMVNLAEKNPDLELEAQRIFETLILMADDYGRGRMLPSIIRSKAFVSTANAIGKVSLENVKDWITEIERQGAIEIYEVGDDKYYRMTGWNKYQDGKWYKKDSLLPPSPTESRKSIEKTSEVSLENGVILVEQVKLSEVKLKELTNHVETVVSPAVVSDIPEKSAEKEPPKLKKPKVPIEEMEFKGPIGRLAKFWHVEYLRRNGIKYSGDLRRINGQLKVLLSRPYTEEQIQSAMTALLANKKDDQFHPHDFDHFVKKVSGYILKGEKKEKEQEVVYVYGTDNLPALPPMEECMEIPEKYKNGNFGYTSGDGADESEIMDKVITEGGKSK